MTSSTMRAVTQQTFGGPEVLQIREVPKPSPLPTEILVRVTAAGINPVDWKTREGTGMAGVLGEPPFILGWDVAGVVEEIGFGVTTFAVGDEVYGMPWFPRAAGGYAEYVTAPARQFARKPSSATFEQAAAVPLAALTAWQALFDTAAVTAGQRVLITAAAGGVGHLAVQFARAHGAEVIATASARNAEWLTGLGAHRVIDYTSVRFEDEISDVDVVIDLVGDHDDTSLRSLRVLRPGGLLIAVPSGVSPDLATAAAAQGKRVSPFLVEPDGPALTRIAALIDAGEVHVEVDQVVPLDAVAKAHEVLAAGHTRGKIVLQVAER
ncbi:NADP-dependent oxidoreductase [Actinoplanes couchii]|uniref:NADPH:quinone reductase n=1 Tax=Actinoplanes couchii TaxID=403638 RepID=A0ABQ3XNB2_9ACTN|nr:NADP-dependent oxidoreductase [Actinoplanes couchii]MDR6318088.1 NADPH:quinone reductase-like Zn-dependent oxidoreductase [Actinoplanes couchii]GID59996.1 NADPH:quinone reductase [Actinoplanes couchii]